jgi:hypothetical protein
LPPVLAELVNLAKKDSFVEHCSSHVMGPEWGHLVIKMSGHPPFSAQVTLNGHNYLERRARRAGTGSQKEGNCFTRLDHPARLAAVQRPRRVLRL